MNGENEIRCPFLGLVDDKDTSVSYPSEWNVCHKCHGHPSPIYDHQEEVCLTAEFNNCEYYLDEKTAWMSTAVKNSNGPAKPEDPGRNRRLVVSIILIVLFTISAFLYFMFKPQLDQTLGFITQPTSTVTVVPTFTNTPVKETSTPLAFAATITPYPTLTKYVFNQCGYELDQEFGGDQKFTIHQIQDGETIDKLLAPFDISYEQVQAVNYFVPQPLWIGFPLILPNYGNDFNSSKTYQALELDEEDIDIEALSQQLGLESAKFIELNGLEKDCNSFSGWFIVPREKVKYYE